MPIENSWNFDGQSIVTECLSTSLKNTPLTLNDLAFSLSPNPARDMVHVIFKNEDYRNNKPIEIRNMEGKLISQSLDNSVDISHLPTGVYLVSVASGEFSFSQRLVVE